MWLCVQFTSETKVLDKRNFQVGEVCDVLSGDVMPTGSRVMSYDNSCGTKLLSYWVLFQFLSLSPSFFVWCGNTFLLESGAQCHSCLDVLRNLKQTLFSTQVTSLDITWSNWAALCVPVGRCVCRHVWVIYGSIRKAGSPWASVGHHLRLVAAVLHDTQPRKMEDPYNNVSKIIGQVGRGSRHGMTCLTTFQDVWLCMGSWLPW